MHRRDSDTPRPSHALHDGSEQCAGPGVLLPGLGRAEGRRCRASPVGHEGHVPLPPLLVAAIGASYWVLKAESRARRPRLAPEEVVLVVDLRTRLHGSASGASCTTRAGCRSRGRLRGRAHDHSVAPASVSSVRRACARPSSGRGPERERLRGVPCSSGSARHGSPSGRPASSTGTRTGEPQGYPDLFEVLHLGPLSS